MLELTIPNAKPPMLITTNRKKISGRGNKGCMPIATGELTH
jgi:hypothetical protein